MRRALLAALSAVLVLPAAPAAARTTVPHGWMGMVAGTQLLNHLGRLPVQFGAMQRNGVQSVKAEFAWSRIEPSKGTYDWSMPDAVVGNAARHHFSVLATVLQAPGWEAGSERGKEFIRHPQDPQDYAAFLTKLVQRYGPHGSFWRTHRSIPKVPVRAWEVWNEPELYYYWRPPWEQGYAALLKAAHKAIKKADPGAKVVLAGLTYTSWKYMGVMYGLGLRHDFDVVSLHPYTSRPVNVVKTMQLVRNVMRKHGDRKKPIWVTELSWTSGKGHTQGGTNQPNFLNSTPKGQANLLRKAYVGLARNRKRYGVGRVYWYTWATADRARNDPFDWSGLLEVRKNKLRPKPALKAYRQVARQLERRR